MRLDHRGFKIGLEVLVRGRYHTFVEVPYPFQNRTAGRSKLGAGVGLGYLHQASQLYLYALLGGLPPVAIGEPGEDVAAAARGG